jgi:hypothetical protein
MVSEIFSLNSGQPPKISITGKVFFQFRTEKSVRGGKFFLTHGPSNGDRQL